MLPNYVNYIWAEAKLVPKLCDMSHLDNYAALPHDDWSGMGNAEPVLRYDDLKLKLGVYLTVHSVAELAHRFANR